MTPGEPRDASMTGLWRLHYFMKELFRVMVEHVTGAGTVIVMGAVIGLMEFSMFGNPVMRLGEATIGGADAAKLRYTDVEELTPRCVGGKRLNRVGPVMTSADMSCLGSGRRRGFISRTSRRDVKGRT